MESVKVASRCELFQILQFFESKKLIPFNCEVHSVVTAALLTNNPCYEVYYLCHLSGDYTAIVGVKKSTAVNPTTNKKSESWMLTNWSRDESALIKVYGAINVIDWHHDVILVIGGNGYYPPDAVLDFLSRRCANEAQYTPNTNGPANRYYVPIAEALKFDVECLRDVYVRSLERRHAGVVYEHWPLKHLTSIDDVGDEIEQMPTAGVFLKETDELVCWATCYLGFGIAHLFTLSPFRRRGYAGLVIRYISKRMAQSGYVVFAGALTDNTNSNALFSKLEGFMFLKPASGLLILPAD